jgi:VanZ family protein
MILIRLGFAVYLLLLSFLLLAPEPLKLLGFASRPGASSLRMVHFCLFTVLGFLVWASRWPVRRGLVVGLLVAYALVTESLQWLVPTRTVDLLDYVENLLGLAAGGAVWHLLRERGPWADRRAIEPTGNKVAAPPAKEGPPPEE